MDPPKMNGENGKWQMGKGGKEQLFCAASISCRVNFNLLLFCDRMGANKTLGYWVRFLFFPHFFIWVLAGLVCEFGLACWSNDISGRSVHSARGQVWNF